MQNKRKFDVDDSDRNVETSDVKIELDLVDSDVEPKQYLGRVYEIRSNKTPLFYIGSTIMSLQNRFKGHKRDSKHGLSQWNKTFKEFKESWKINQVGDTLILPGISKEEMRKQLLVLEYSHMATFPREILLNDCFGTESLACKTKRAKTIQDYSIHETRIVKQRKIEGHKARSRGGVSFRPKTKTWLYFWPKRQKSKSFQTQEAALAFQQTIFPKVALPPDPSYVYLIFHPDQTKVYVGQTSLTLSERMGQHRQAARRGGNEFYLLMKTTSPLTWKIKAIHTLYDVSKEEILAVELFCLRQYKPSELFNTILNVGGICLSKSWNFGYYVGGKNRGKSFAETKTRSLKQAENEAKEYQRKHIEAGRGGNGTLSLRKRFQAYGPFGGKQMTKSFNITHLISEEQAKTAAEEWLAEMRSKEDIRNETIAKTAIEKSAKFAREFQVTCDK